MFYDLRFGMADSIEFTESWKSYFDRFGLRVFEDFFDHRENETIGKNSKRSVHKFALGEGEDRKVFFMKKFHNPHLKDTIKAMCSYGWGASQARIEWGNAGYLLANGIDTYKPVCMGERGRWGIENKSFIVTQELTSTCLVDFVMEEWRGIGRAMQEKIVVAVAKHVRKIHDLNISFPDLYVWHIFVYRESLAAEIQFSIIDLHRMSRAVRSGGRKIKELGRLWWSMAGEYFDDELKGLLVDTYLEDRSDSEKAALMKVIRRCGAELDRKRTLKHYYRTTGSTKKAGTKKGT